MTACFNAFFLQLNYDILLHTLYISLCISSINEILNN